MLIDLQCCGVKELHGISGFSATAGQVGPALKVELRGWIGRTGKITTKFGVAMFTGATNSVSREADYATRVEAYIQEHKLGNITKVGPLLNPNSGNYITVYLWTLDQKKVATWLSK